MWDEVENTFLGSEKSRVEVTTGGRKIPEI
jgi:hypothetical protein